MDYRLLHAKTVAQLRALAKEEKIKIPAGAPKAKIVELLLQVENERAAELVKQQAAAQLSAEQKLREKRAAENDGGSTGSPSVQETAPVPATSADGSQPAPVRRRGRPPKAVSAKPAATEREQKSSPVEAINTTAEPAADTPSHPVDNLQNQLVDNSPAHPAIKTAPASVDNSPVQPVDNIRPVRASQPRAESSGIPQRAANSMPSGNKPYMHERRVPAVQNSGDAPKTADPQERNANRPARAYGYPFRAADPRAEQPRYPRRESLSPDADPRAEQPRSPRRESFAPDADPRAEQPRYLRRESASPDADPRAEQPRYPRRESLSPDADPRAEQPRYLRRESASPDADPRAEQPRSPRRESVSPDIDSRTEQPRYARREHFVQDPAEVTQAVSDLLAAGDCAQGGGVLEPMPDGYGFLRAENYQQGTKDVYVSAAQIRRFDLRVGDLVYGKVRPQREGDRYTGLLFIDSINGQPPSRAIGRPRFEDLTPIYPQKRIRMESGGDMALRVIDMLAPIGRGQRALIVSQPKAGKTVLLKKIANAITENEPDIELIVLLIDERPEEVTDMQRSIKGDVVYSTFDEVPENHTRVAEMVLERAQRLVEQGKDVVILLDSITRLARAYNLVIPPTGRTLSGGMDPGALHKPKRFFGAARNIENGGSLTIIATALVETGSRMDDVIFEEFKGTGNSEIHLDRRLSEKRIFPAIDMNKSGTRRDDLLLTPEEAEGALIVRRMLSGGSNQDAVEQLLGMLQKTSSNSEFFQLIKAYFNAQQKDGFIYTGR